MESFKFMAGMAADSAMEAISSTQERAKEQMGRVSSEMSTGMSRLAGSASDMASIDLGRLSSELSLEKLKESAMSTSLPSLGTPLSGWPASRTSDVEAGAAASSAPPGSGGVRAAAEDGSESGGEDGKGGTTVFGSLASRLGMQTTRNAEKEQLMPKKDGAVAGGSECSSSISMSDFSRMGSNFGASLSARVQLAGSSVTGGVSSIRESVNVTLGTVPPKEPEGLVGKACQCCPTLTYRQRMMGFLVCFAFGSIMTLSALSSLGGLLIGNAGPFAFKYTVGNLLSIGSSSFLVGPQKQCRDMLAPERATASLIYIVTLFLTLWSCFYLKVQILTFLFIVMQFCALTWYMLSYVPYGQQCVRRMLKRMTS
uniref:Vesicle transport protein n=1 Tax=Coccolithus braarudii TaxID=221442 RepID=A0A7S0LDK2_9EUKA|mmetsp:Transcript_34586/g.73859  ORF Transcript_34586/g.73859 Transcript_34586/m.73859 type:complete len:369 (+) Transcript_34586:56-1162(+)